MPLSHEMQVQLGLCALEGREGVYVSYDESCRCAFVYQDEDGLVIAGIWYLDAGGQPVDNHMGGSEPWTRDVAMQELKRREDNSGNQGTLDEGRHGR